MSYKVIRIKSNFFFNFRMGLVGLGRARTLPEFNWAIYQVNQAKTWADNFATPKFTIEEKNEIIDN